MAGAAFAFQKMAFDALNVGPAVAGGRIYDFVPDRAVFPYISFGNSDAGDDSGTTAAEGDSEVTLTLDIWSQQDGWLEADTIAEAIYARLNRVVLTQSSGHRSVLNYERDRGHFRDSDGKTRHVVCRYRAKLERA
jgi:hypothetical protein